MGHLRQILSFFVIAGFWTLPVVAQIKPKLSDEQIFLYKIFEKQSDITVNANWKKIEGSEKWELILEDFAYNQRKETIRFVGQKNLLAKNQFFIVTYKSDHGKWYPRYGTRGDGSEQILATFNKDTSEFVMYITPLNVEDKFKTAKIAYDDDRFAIMEQLANSTIDSTKDKDIHHRQLVEQVFGIDQEKAAQGTKKKYPFLYANKVDQDGLVKQTATNTLYGSLYGILMFKDSFVGGFTQDQYLSNLSNPKYFETTTINSTSYKKIKDEVVKKYMAMDRPRRISSTSEIFKFNQEIDNIKNICEKLRVQKDQSVNDAGLNHGYFITPQNEFVVEQQMKKDADRATAIGEKYQALADAGAKAPMDFINHISPLASLWAAKTFEEAVGHFDAEDCVYKGKNMGLGKIHFMIIEESMSEVQNLFIEAINKNVEIIESKPGTYGINTLKKMIRSSPIAIRTALQQRKVITEAAYVGQSIQEIYSKDQFNVYVDNTLMGVGFVAGILAGAASGGTLGAAIFYVMLSADAVALARGGSQWYDAYFIDEKIRQSMIAGQMDSDHAKEGLALAQADKKAGQLNVGMTLGGNVAGYGIGKGIQAYSKSGTKAAVAVDKEVASAASRAEQTTAKTASQSSDVVVDPAPKTSTKVTAAAGKKSPSTSSIKENPAEILEQKIKAKLGSKVTLLHMKGDKGLIRNADGQLQEIFIHGDDVDLEVVVQSKKIGDTEWKQDGPSIVKTTQLESGTVVDVMEDTKLIQVSFEDGSKIVSKYDSTLDDYLASFVISTNDKGLKISKGFVYRTDDKIVLIQNDGTVLKGKRVGSDIFFSNQNHEEYFSVADQKIFEVESQRWGKPSKWKRVTMDEDTDDVAGFDIPTLKDDGLPSGYGDINCSGMAFSGDAWLSKKAPLSSSLPDAHYKDIDFSLDLKDIVENSPTITSQNAAKHYHSFNETFNDYISVQERLAKMDEGGTALVYAKNQDGSVHVFNVKKENGKIIYYDFQARTVSTDAQAQFFHNGIHPIDIVETTKYHQSTDLMNTQSKIDFPASHSTDIQSGDDTPALGKVASRNRRSRATEAHQGDLFDQSEFTMDVPPVDLVHQYKPVSVDIEKLRSPTESEIRNIYQDKHNYGDHPNQIILLQWDKVAPSKYQHNLFLELIQNELHFKTLDRAGKQVSALQTYYEVSGDYYFAWKSNEINFGRLFQNTREGIFIADKNGKIFSLNSLTDEQLSTAVLLSHHDVNVVAGSNPKLKHFVENKFLASNSQKYFQRLAGNKLKAWETVQKDILSKYPRVNQKQVMDILYDAHITGNEWKTTNATASMQKLRALAKARRELRRLGISSEDSDRIIKTLADKNIMVLGNAEQTKKISLLVKSFKESKVSKNEMTVVDVEFRIRESDETFYEYVEADELSPTAAEFTNKISEIQNGRVVSTNQINETILMQLPTGEAKIVRMDEIVVESFKNQHLARSRFETPATAQTKTFRDEFLSNQLVQGDQIKIGNKIVTIYHQHGDIVVVKDKEDLYYLSRDQIEKSQLYKRGIDKDFHQLNLEMNFADNLRKIENILPKVTADQQSYAFISYKWLDLEKVEKGYVVSIDHNIKRMFVTSGKSDDVYSVRLDDDKIEIVNVSEEIRPRYRLQASDPFENNLLGRFQANELTSGDVINLNDKLAVVVVQQGDQVVISDGVDLKLFRPEMLEKSVLVFKSTDVTPFYKHFINLELGKGDQLEIFGKHYEVIAQDGSFVWILNDRGQKRILLEEELRQANLIKKVYNPYQIVGNPKFPFDLKKLHGIENRIEQLLDGQVEHLLKVAGNQSNSLPRMTADRIIGLTATDDDFWIAAKHGLDIMYLKKIREQIDIANLQALDEVSGTLEQNGFIVKTLYRKHHPYLEITKKESEQVYHFTALRELAPLGGQNFFTLSDVQDIFVK